MAFKPVNTTQGGKKEVASLSKEQLMKAQMKEEMVTLEEERVYREGTVAIRDLIAPSAFKVDSTFIQLGDIFLRTLFVITYPRYISVGWSTPILNLNITMDIAMFFYPIGYFVEVCRLHSRCEGGIRFLPDALIESAQPEYLPAQHDGQHGNDGYGYDLERMFHAIEQWCKDKLIL